MIRGRFILCLCLMILGSVQAAETPDLPQVLMIGDSISMGYNAPLKELLQGKAKVIHNPGNAQHSAYGLANLDAWLGDTPWDVIHFNHGLHDLKYVNDQGTNTTSKKDGHIQIPLDEYEKNMEAIVVRLKQTGARLIFATTTPFPKRVSGPLRETLDAARYNVAALGVMQRHGIRVNDLYSFVQGCPDALLQPNNVHFTKEGSRALAEQVARHVLEALSAAKPTWESLQHEPSEWMMDAKFGIYTHWGAYSVPAFETEWYAKRMYDEGSSVHKHHVKTYGDPKTFGYRKLIPLFKAEKWDPAKWAELMKASGAQYAGMAVVHHDGFLLWDSDINRWNAKNMGPKRDCFGDYVQALRNEGLKTIATFHHIRTFNWYLPGVGGLGGAIPADRADAIKAQGWDLTNPQYKDLYWNELAGARYEDFLAEWQAKVREVVDKYQPDVLWFDGGSYREGDSEQIVLNLLDYYQQRAMGWGKPIEVLNKLPVTGLFNFPPEYGILTFEEGRDRLARVERPWIDDMKISNRAWCYVEGQKYKTANEIIDGLVDRVARGGGLLLNFSPRADGTVAQAQKQSLLGVGRWLKAHGEAVYATRPWKVVGEGDESRLRSRQWKFTACNGSDIRFTRSKDGRMLYAIVLGWPKNGKLKIATLGRQTVIADQGIGKVTLLGQNGPLPWRRDAIALHVDLPTTLDKNQPAYVLKIEPKGALSLN